MRVYRGIKLQEVINMYKNESNERINNSSLNTHIYMDDKEYIHFFRYYEFAEYYFNLKKDGSYDRVNDNYILFMIANIPDEILKKYQGFGFYQLNNEDTFMPEYAIPTDLFKPEYIVNITNKPMGFYMRRNEDDEYRKYLELIRNLKQSGKNLKSIASDLLKVDLEELIDVKVDKRSEKEVEEDSMRLLSTMEYPEDNDLEITDVEFIRK